MASCVNTAHRAGPENIAMEGDVVAEDLLKNAPIL